MKLSHAVIVAGAALGTPAMAAGGVPAPAKLVTNCPGNDQLCYSVSVPASSASSGKGDVFFQIQAPATYEWAALGQGFQMAGSNIFIVYADAARTNVTLSPRLGTGDVEPLLDTSAQVELLAGSGIANGLMTANVRCANCASWSGGSMSFTDAASSWIWAYKAGSAVGSNSLSVNLPVHDTMGTLEFDLTKAVGGSDSINPFVKTDGSTAPKATPLPTASTPGASSSSGDSSGAGTSTATMAHGVIMGITMLALFPCGILLRRVAPRTSIWTHAGVQSVALVATVVAAGLGIFIGAGDGNNTSSHALLGLAVTILMVLQPVWGILQHKHFRRSGARGPFGWAHRVLGAIAILLGIVNGGLGLQLADNVGSSGGNAYVLGAAVLGCIYGTTFVATALTKRAAANHNATAHHRAWHKLGEERADSFQIRRTDGA